MPLPITILFYIGNPSTQCICLLVYYIFFFLLSMFVPYRRRIYRATTLFCCSVLLLNSIICLLVSEKIVGSVVIEGVALGAIIILLGMTLMQFITNYSYFV